jgi:hypothetical protein
MKVAGKLKRMHHQEQLPRNFSHKVNTLKAIALGTFPPRVFINTLINEKFAQQHSGN